MSSPPNTVYTLSNPPKAPKKAPAPIWRTWALEGIPPFPNLEKEEEEEKAALAIEEEWAIIIDVEREILESWNLRPKLLQVIPSEVRFIECEDTLNFLYRRFASPSSQPRNVDEILFHEMMVEAVLDRITSLNLQHCS